MFIYGQIFNSFVTAIRVLLLLDLQRAVITSSSFTAVETSQCTEKCECSPLNNTTVDCNGLEAIPVISNMEIFSLKIANSNIPTIFNDSFLRMNQLKRVILIECQITKIEIHAFRNLMNLEVLELSGNKLLEMDLNLFKSNIHLKTLWLGSNTNLQAITGGPFPSLPQLRTLSLNQCNIFHLRNDTFRELISLEYLHLDGNLMTEIDVNLFQTNIKLISLYLYSNKNLTRLTGGPFPPLPQLTKLSLSSCNLSYFENDIFVNLVNLKELFLKNNKFETMSSNIFRPLENLKFLQLESNPWNCDCNLTGIWEFYTRKISLTYSGSDLICKQPNFLFNRTWGSLKFEDFVCRKTGSLIKGTDENSELPNAGASAGTEQSLRESSDTTATIAISISVVILVLGIFTIGAYFKFRNNNMDGLANQELRFFRTGNGNSVSVEGNDADILNAIENAPYNPVYEIHTSRFNWDPTSILGKGNYGIVYKGTYKNKPVAIKTYNSSCNNTSLDSIIYIHSLLSEIKLMCYLTDKNDKEITEHSGKLNIVSFIGANTKDIRKGIFLISEYCELGNLLNYIRENRENFNSIVLYLNAPSDTSESEIIPDEPQMSTLDLTKWAYEIANGMAYITSRNIIHGDLAARNILLTSTRVAKIADFGLSRRLYEYSSYTRKNQEPMPWRWMAIESLKDLTFSTQSDIWSYGITLWEIFSLAQVPYPGLNWTIDFVKKLEQGLRPERPEHASQNLYNLIKQTWKTNPAERLDFEGIRIRMRIILQEYTNQNYEPISLVQDDTAP